jgi:tetratricopeptide (TPR) repeat protein
LAKQAQRLLLAAAPEDARKLLQEAVALRPGFAPYHALLAQTWPPEAAEAEDAARRVTTLSPLDADAQAQLGRVLAQRAATRSGPLRLQDLRDAEAAFRIALQLAPTMASRWNELGWNHLDLAAAARADGDHVVASVQLDQADACLRTSLRLDPLYDRSYLLAAELELARGRTNEAAGNYRRALDSNAWLPEAWAGLASLHALDPTAARLEQTANAHLASHADIRPALRVLVLEV